MTTTVAYNEAQITKFGSQNMFGLMTVKHMLYKLT